MAKRPTRLFELPLEKNLEELLNGHYTASRDDDGQSTSITVWGEKLNVPPFLSSSAHYILEKMPAFKRIEAVHRDNHIIGATIRIQSFDDYDGRYDAEIRQEKAIRALARMESLTEGRRKMAREALPTIQKAIGSQDRGNLQDFVDAMEESIKDWPDIPEKESMESNLSVAKNYLAKEKKEGRWDGGQDKLAIVRELPYNPNLLESND